MAAVAEASVDDQSETQVEEAYIAFDCGTFVNRDTVVTPAEGAVVFGMSGALYGEITATVGAVSLRQRTRDEL